MNRSALALVAVILFAAVGMSLPSQAQTKNQPPSPPRSRSDEMLESWNGIGNKLIAMAQDFPEDKYECGNTVHGPARIFLGPAGVRGKHANPGASD